MGGTYIVEVELSAASKHLTGMTLDWDDGVTLVVTNIEPGLIEDWNNQHPNERVRIGDRISAVNDLTRPPEDLAELLESIEKQDTSNRQIKLVMKRHAEFDAALIRQDPADRLGVELRYREGGTTLLVRRVMDEGIVADWNRKHAGMKIKVGDRVVEVNGARGLGSMLNDKVK